MLIGILQTGEAPDALRPDTGDYPDMFETLLSGHGFAFRTWRVLEMDFPASVHAADGWLITGSRHGAYDDLPFIKPLEAFIRDAYEAHVPLVGVCFGHQIVAQAMGGKVEKFPGGWSIGPQDYDFDGRKMTVNAWHQDQVTVAPPNATRIASSEFCENAAFLYDDRAFTVQPHPEMSDAFVAALIETRAKGVVPDPLRQEAAAKLGTPLDSASLGDRMAAFFKAPRQIRRKAARA